MKNIKTIILILLVLFLTLVSCEDAINGTGYDNDPNGVNDAPAAILLGKAELVASYVTESDPSRYAAINSGYLSGVANQWIGINNYSYVPSDFDRTWDNIYVEGIKQVKIVKSKAIESGNLELLGTAQLIEAYLFGELASAFGDVPFNEVFDADIDNPSYDQQTVVLQNVLDLLDNAIINAGNNNSFLNDGVGGITTNSNIANVAHSLKARYYLILKDYSNALIEAQQGITSRSNDLVTIHEDSPGSQNFYYQFLEISRNGDTAPTGSHLEALLDNTNASVVRSLITPGDSDRYNYYYNATGSRFNTTSGGIFAADAILPVISWYETKLIEAEAAYRTGSDAIALSALNDVRNELASQFGGSFPASTATGTTILNHIMEEKYVTVFPSSQTFFDISRTNNLVGVIPNTGASIPERFLYSQGEIDSNTSIPNPLPSIFDPTDVNN